MGSARVDVRHVCVIGGGPAGLASAIALAQTGRRVTVVDHAVPPIDKACGEGLMPDSLETLSQLGISLPVEAGLRFRGIRFSDAQFSVAADFPRGAGLGVRRVVLHNLLLERAESLGVKCIWGAKAGTWNGLQPVIDGRALDCDLTVAADGQNSPMRTAAGLDKVIYESRRFGFRRHYRMAPWSHYMELHWGPHCQIYITPVGPEEICVASISRHSSLRLDQALAFFPGLQERLASAPLASRERGALSVSRKLSRVWNRNIVLAGDASGSIDAITGEGLCLSFKQALALTKAIDSGNLANYQSEHRRLSWRPRMMSRLMLTLDHGLQLGSNAASIDLQRRALQSLSLHPKVFESLLAVHVGHRSFSDLVSWRLVQFCQAFLTA